MKIAIFTFWWSSDNYGQQLQAYALQKYLRDEGHEAFLVRYNSQNDIISTPLWLRILKAFNPVKLFKFVRDKIKSKKRSILREKEQIENPRHFEEFRNKYISFMPTEYKSYDELVANPPEADIYIVGSDQVWNFSICRAKKVKGKLHAYFLDFGKLETKRISYAASWGRAELPKDQRKEIEPLIRKFDFVTVRERSGVELCKTLGVDAKWVCDPTMLLSADIYRELYKSEGVEKIKKPYILFYYLDNGGKFDKESVYQFAKNRSLDVEYVSGNSCFDSYPKNYATVPQWLSLVDNAEYVVTNSFHCCVFSILFGKRFGAVKLTGGNSGMNERLESLFEMIECGERYVTDEDFSVLDVEWNGKIEQNNFLMDNELFRV